jgi:hypothetical protein
MRESGLALLGAAMLIGCGGSLDGQEDPSEQGQAVTPSTTLATGDSRSVSQPSLPAVCTTLTAKFTTSQRSSPPSSDDTSRIAAALSS